MRKSAPTDFQSTLDIGDGVGRVTIDAVDDNGDFINFLKFEGSVVRPDVTARPIKIEQTGPGRYEASFDARDVGSYVVSVVRKDQEDVAPDVTVVNIPYPSEYKDIEPNTALLKRLASETSGAYGPKPRQVFGGKFRRSVAYTDLWRTLALVAVLLLPLDVAVRRLQTSAGQFAEVYVAARYRIRDAQDARRRARLALEGVESVGTLLKGKRERATIAPKQPPVQPIKVDAQPPPEPTHAASQPEPGRKPTSAGSTASRLLDAKRRVRQTKE
jgi:hypothetical protein